MKVWGEGFHDKGEANINAMRQGQPDLPAAQGGQILGTN